MTTRTLSGDGHYVTTCQPAPPLQTSAPFQFGKGIYQDTGCFFSQTCVTCPLPVCRYEMDPGKVKSSANAVRRERAAFLRQ